MTWKHTFLVVTGCALVGMMMGGVLGCFGILIEFMSLRRSRDDAG
ncbi:MAG: hypothetical protein O2931_03360 [Planctomycetota bacterium]|nr:hypothetical protein [Planctomycetota bacterium]